MSNPFLSRHREVVEAVRAGKGPDLRVFILDKLDGKLSTQFFDRRGSGFAQWYAQDNRSNPYVYRRDCQNIVLARFKDRVWNSIAEKEAAYLLLPYTEEIRQSVEQLLDERYQQYLEAEFADDPEERVARAAEGKPAVIPDWDGLCSATLPTASPRMGARCRLWTGCSPSARYGLGERLGLLLRGRGRCVRRR